MNKIKLIFLCFPFFGYAQVTTIPDSNFELVLVNLGLDNMVDGFVLNSRIDTLTSLIVSSCNIQSLMGIAAFQSLTYLDCSSNNMDTLNLTNNYLSYLDCSDNKLIEIDVSSHLNLQTFKCSYNEFIQIDVSQNTSLLYFECIKNKLTSLDISNNIFLTELWCNDNNLSDLDVAGIDMYVLVCDNNQLTTIDNLSDNISLKHLSCSGNNISSLLLLAHPQLNWLSCSENQLFQLDISSQMNLSYLFTWHNSSLNCINVADVSLANATWSVWDGQSGNIDGHHYFSANCILSSTFQVKDNKRLSSILNLKGQQSRIVKNKPLFYKYNDGSVEQKIIFE
jgi:Leucine-rich repeat (LRR) protein